MAWASGPLPIRRYRENERNGFQQGLILAAIEHGHPFVEDHNAPGSIGVGPLPVNAVDGVRISAAHAYLGPLRGSKNLTIRADTLVDRVVLERGHATGVQVASSDEIIGADLVILAAGTYASPALLMRSGIGPASDLAGFGVECHVDLPGVGRNLPIIPGFLPAFP
ncbi:MAG TPA: GMC family oxidoreductase N-terminal domain-containing protein [Xanthobacteraceae bacterium]|nr:GMC family oxidoreductase N-terminal domain-containing protein [Xanthobacteraceae bacterium]